jgi:murein DD-endopeptidase MepM/ murein hydrolase activator NlpD
MEKPNIRLFLYFLFTLIKYFELKLFKLRQAVTFYKKWTVRKLLWKRGFLFRPATHFGLALLAFLAVVGGAIFGPLPSLALPNQATTSEVVAPPTTAQTAVPEDRPRAEVIDHEVAGGETLSTLAAKYNISVETIKWSNSLGSDQINPGQKLTVLPVTGVLHKVAAGENLEKIAKLHQASSQAILDFPFNDIPDDLSLKVGQTLVIPDGRPIEVARPNRSSPAPTNFAQTPSRPASRGGWVWPVDGYISQYPSWYHMALDIAGPAGTPIVAAKSGTVVVAENLWYGYGRYVEIGHGDGTHSLYAHMTYFVVRPGQHVSQGQVIGYRGSTGRSTGSHLHFEVRVGDGSFGERRNPLGFLP